MRRKELSILILLVVLCGIVAFMNPQFLSAANIQNTSRLIGTYGIFSIGVGIVVITGGIDLSVGSMFALLGVLLSMMLTEWHWPASLTVAAFSLGSGWDCCMACSLPVCDAAVHCDPLRIIALPGLARYIAADTSRASPAAMVSLAGGFTTGRFFAGPLLFLMIVVGAAMWVMLHRSVYGRHLFAVGRNEEAARYSGIQSHNVILSAYGISGFLAAVASILIAFYTNSVSPSSHGNFYELYAIAAAVLGGCSLRGGEGSIIGIVIGTALLQVLRNLVNLLDIPGSLDFAVMGAVILIGVTADQVLSARKSRSVQL
jgi:ribose transport system permease protein